MNAPLAAPPGPGPCAYLDALASGLPASKRDGHWVMLLQGFFDDSGSHAGSGAYVLGGFISTVGNWKQFNDEWRAALGKDPSIDYFKMSEASSRRGQFDGWPPPLRDQRVFELAEIAEKHSVARISAVVMQEDFNEHIKGVTPWQELNDPYFMLFYQIVILTSAFLHHLGEKTRLDVSNAGLDFVFDEQGPVGYNALAWWGVLKQALDPDLLRFIGSSPTFSTDQKFPALQAADLYAWHVRNIFEGGDDSVRTRAVVEVLRKVPPYGGHVTGEQMRESLPRLIELSEQYRR